MKHARFVWTALAVVVVAGAAAPALACGTKGKIGVAASVASMSSGCTTKAAACSTPEMAAACASGKGVKAAGATAAAGTVKGTACCAAGAKATTAAAAGTVNALPAAGPGVGAGKAAGSCAHTACDACRDMAAFESEIAAAGGHVQVVPLKNGVMYVYTAESSAKVRAVQAAVVQHGDRMAAMNAAADKATLCPDCRALRGARASGKLSREVVNIENGCLALLTSSDPQMVAKLHAMAGSVTASRTKS